MLPSAHPTTLAPRCSLSRLITTACTLAVYASWRGLLLPPRKTRFRWVASPCRVGFGPTGSTTKGFGFCLVHVPFSLPRLRLAQGASLRDGCQGRSDNAFPKRIGPHAEPSRSRRRVRRDVPIDERHPPQATGTAGRLFAAQDAPKPRDGCRGRSDSAFPNGTSPHAEPLGSR